MMTTICENVLPEDVAALGMSVIKQAMRDLARKCDPLRSLDAFLFFLDSDVFGYWADLADMPNADPCLMFTNMDQYKFKPGRRPNVIDTNSKRLDLPAMFAGLTPPESKRLTRFLLVALDVAYKEFCARSQRVSAPESTETNKRGKEVMSDRQ